MDRKRPRDAVDGMETSGDSPDVGKKRRRADDLHLAFVAGKEVAKENAQREGERVYGQRAGVISH